MTIALYCNSALAAASQSAASAALFTATTVRSDRSATLPELLRIIASNRQSVSLRPADFVYPNFIDHPERINQADRTPVNPNDGSIQNFPGVDNAPAVDLSFNGIGQADAPGGGLPPDSNGDIGVQYYVQYINTDWAIFDKTNGSRLGSVMAGNTFWAGFGGPCETDNAGDPIVLFDKLANRWLFSQFVSADNPRGSQCFAISDRQDLMDPELRFFRYQFDFPSGVFNDYPHIGIWTDAEGTRSGYYFVTHDFQLPLDPPQFLGATFVVVERDRMLAGEPAQLVGFQNVTAFGGSAFGALPAHLESVVLPPGGTCAPFVHSRADLDAYLLWQLCVDWSNAVPATLTAAVQLAANAPFSGAVNRVPQPPPAAPGSELDSLTGRTMYRASTRVYPQTSGLPIEMVINHVADAGNGQSGVRWVDIAMQPGTAEPPLAADEIFSGGFEATGFRLMASNWILDQGLFAPDPDNRWMGAISIDQNANLGLAYSVSSLSTFPSVRYTGRTPELAPGTMLNEQVCGIGGGSQTFIDGDGDAGRWGDYSSMSIDPSDQCTFWMSVEYYATSGISDWENRICSFQFPDCGKPTFLLRQSGPSQFDVCTQVAGDPEIQLELFALGGFASDVTLSDSLPGGANATFSTNPVTSYPGTSTVTLLNLDLAGASDFSFVLQGTSVAPALSRSVSFHMTVSSSVAGMSLLRSPADGSTDQSAHPTLTWDAVPGALLYTIEIATDAAFDSIVETATTSAANYAATTLLESGTQYFWRVTTSNNCGPGSVSTEFEFTTGIPGQCPAGTTANVVFSDDIEGDVSDWSMPPDPVGSGNTWAQSGVRFNSGATAFLAVDSSTTSDQYLLSPPIAVPMAGQEPITLSFWNYQNIESNLGQGEAACWDGALLEVSTDGGANFVQVPSMKLLTDPYNGSVAVQAASPISGLDAWCANDLVPVSGDQQVVSIVDLETFAGQTIQLRFRLGTNNFGGDEGWYIDDVTVQGCVAP